MTTVLPMYVFTSELPSLEFSQAGTAAVEVKVWAGGTKLLDTSLYPVAGKLYLHDLGTLFEEHLRSQTGEDRSPYAIMEIDIDNYVWEDYMVIYCPYACNMTAQEFISKYFLTTLTAKRIPPDASPEDETLPYLLTEAEAAAARSVEVTAAFLTPEGEVVGHTCSYTDRSRYQYDGFANNPSDLNILFDHFCQEAHAYDWRDLVPLSYTIRMGQRSFTYYVDRDFRPSVRFRFLNAFCAPETIYLEAATVTKTATERSLATSHGVALFYDQVDSQEYEVSTAPLTAEEAAWATQLLLSHRVQRVEEDGSLTEVLITDMTSEVTDSDEEHRRLKFTYRLSKQGAALWLRKGAIAHNRFTQAFSLHFK